MSRAGKSEQAATDVRRYINDLMESGHFNAGAMLPTERALTEKLAVPRTVVRDVLAVFEAEGRVVRTVGSGTYVASPSASKNLGTGSDIITADVSPAEFLEVRLTIEPQIMALVIANATGADFDLMDECNRRIAESTTFEEFEHWDAKFHSAIANAAHNKLITAIFTVFNHARNNTHWGQLRRGSISSFNVARDSATNMHAIIVAALRARDTKRAQKEMTKHLRHAETKMLRAIGII
jgi:DNA-binding FadR family transcriptional regulator